MKKTCLLCLLILAVCAANANAWPRWRHKPRHKVNTPAENRMDKNNDGWVQPREAAAARHHAYYRNRADVNRPWEQAADRNNDGVVDGTELRKFHLRHLDANHNGRIDSAERTAYWDRRWTVNTAVERKYDANGDGFLEWPEAREMLRDKHALIVTHGQAKVDTDLELEFDANDDGILDRAEAVALLAALDADD